MRRPTRVGEVFIGDDYLAWARTQPPASRWAALPTGRVPAIGFWYRTSPRLLIPKPRIGGRA